MHMPLESEHSLGVCFSWRLGLLVLPLSPCRRISLYHIATVMCGAFHHPESRDDGI